MSNDKQKPRQGRWDHLLREIPSQKVSKPSPPPVQKQADLFETLEPQMETAEEPQQETENIYKVSQLNRAIKNILEGEFIHIWVQGEISNFKAHTSGHHYFSLKDDKAQINAVMFKGYNSKLKFRPESGMEVLVRGKISVYEPRGNYQIFCEHMEPVGAGALQKAFEQLKAKLDKEGLFAQEVKKPIPAFPQKVGVVTSPTGAAIQDILNVLGRRSKRVQVVVIPARVQGDGAAAEVVRGIELANQVSGFDVLIVGRGGGSIEDLWCFNEEIVARAIFASKIPVISAVGHEIDFTIADFVADMRAPTPSAAAEVVAKSEQELVEKLRFFSRSLRLVMFQRLGELKKHVDFQKRRLLDPRKYVEDAMMRLEEWRQRLMNAMSGGIERRKLNTKVAYKGLKNPIHLVERAKQKHESLLRFLINSQKKQLSDHRAQLKSAMGLMDSLSPLRTVDRGYGIVRAKGQLVADVATLKEKEIEIELRDGFISAEVQNTRKKEKTP